MTTAIDKVFSANGPSQIIFGDFLANDPRHWRVSRAFRAASQNALVHVGNEILGGRVVAQKPPKPEEVEAAEARLPQVFAELKQKIEGLQERFPRTTKLIAYWDATAQAYHRWTQEPAGEGRNRRICLLTEQLQAANRHFDAYAAVSRNLNFQGEYFSELIESFAEIAMRDRLERRFAAVIEREQLNSQNPETISSCFAALYRDQNRSIHRMHPDLQGLARPEDFSSHFFRSAEYTVFEQQQEQQDVRLSRVWPTVRQPINAGPPADTLSAASIRDWMNNPANEAQLSPVHRLQVVHGPGQIPPEMGRLSGLRELTWIFHEWNFGGQRYHLPDEFANLQQLESLCFVGSRFVELPDVLTRLPALGTLTFQDQREPITRLPDAFERQLHSGWQNLRTLLHYEAYRAQRFLDFFGLPTSDFIRRANLNDPYFGLDYAQFTEIPFRVWFRETIGLPNIPFAIFLLMLEGITKLRDFIHRAVGVQGEHMWIDQVLPITLLALFGCPTLFFAIPFMLVNFFLNLVVEPAITAVRDYFGYSRMVHVERRDRVLERLVAPYL